jgi:hypothetical protein
MLTDKQKKLQKDKTEAANALIGSLKRMRVLREFILLLVCVT